jgi:SPP1 family phage portal protein
VPPLAKSETQPLLAGDVQVTDDGVYIFPVDKELTAADVQAVILYHESAPRMRFRLAMKYYKGDQAIFDGGAKADFRPDNRLMINYAAYNIDTFNGFFAGIPPKITLDGDDAGNQSLQDWHSADDFVDQFSELSKQADIYGRSYMQVYQDEDGETRTTVVSPERALMIYDDTVARGPVAFVSYAYDATLKLTGVVYTKDATYPFTDDVQMSTPNGAANVYGVVPAVEFVENEERLGVNHNVMSLLDGLNKAQSQKANQVEYFDNAYLVLFGIDLDDENGDANLNLDGNQILYSKDADATNARAEFLSKPDGDTMQEHHIDRLIEQIHQVAMIPNMNDEAFSGNSSGVALEYKLSPKRVNLHRRCGNFIPSFSVT